MKNVIELESAPNIDIGLHCHEPYDCDFKGTCWKHIPEYSVFDISNLNKKKKFDLYNRGITTLDQVDLSQTKLSENQILQVESEVKKESLISTKMKLKSFLHNLNYPLYTI